MLRLVYGTTYIEAIHNIDKWMFPKLGEDFIRSPGILPSVDILIETRNLTGHFRKHHKLK